MKTIFSLLIFVFTFQLSMSQSNSKSNVKVKNSSSNTSISISDTNQDYSFSAKFGFEKTPQLKSIVEKKLGIPTDNSSKNSTWEGKGYFITITQGKALIEVEKDLVNKSYLEKLKNLGDTIAEFLESPKTPEPPKSPR